MSYCIYLRKSRKDTEAELHGDGETLSRHEKALTEFAKNSGLEVSAVYREVVSGESIVSRPQMQRLLSEVGEGIFDGVIVMDIDRLARGNSIDQGIIAQTFMFSDTKIITPTKTYDPSNEFDEEYFEFGLYMSRREYKIINRRLQRGRTASCKEGKYVCSHAPYGYERIKINGDKGFTLLPVPEQAEIVQKIFKWYTEGKLCDDGTKKTIGVSLIARELNKISVRPPKGAVWTSSTIRDILINPVYIGKIRWNWRPEKKKMSGGLIIRERPRSNDFLLYDGLHDAIVSEDIFEMAQAIMQKNKSRPVRADKTVKNPLAGLIICSKCGRKMQRRPASKNADMLICAEPSCNNHASYICLIEERVLEFVNKWEKKHHILPVKNDEIIKNTLHHEELSSVIKAEAKINTQLDKAFEAFETGIYDTETFKTRSSALKIQLADIQKQKAEYQKYIRSAMQKENLYNEFIPKIKTISSLYHTLPTAKDKNDILKEIIDHIDYIKHTRGHGHEREFDIVIYPKFK